MHCQTFYLLGFWTLHVSLLLMAWHCTRASGDMFLTMKSCYNRHFLQIFINLDFPHFAGEGTHCGVITRWRNLFCCMWHLVSQIGVSKIWSLIYVLRLDDLIDFICVVLYMGLYFNDTQGHRINGLVQDCSISSASALETLQSCTKPLINIKVYWYLLSNWFASGQWQVSLFCWVAISC